MEREPDCLVTLLGAVAAPWGGAGCGTGVGGAEGSVVQGARGWGRVLGARTRGPARTDSPSALECAPHVGTAGSCGPCPSMGDPLKSPGGAVGWGRPEP